MGWSVKIKSIQDDDWSNTWVGSEIICLKPCIVIRESICVPCKVLMSSDHHAGDLALRSPKMTVNWDFEQSVLLSNSSKPDKKDSNLEVLWLGDLYTTATYHFLFCIVTSQTRHSVKDVMFTMRTGKDSSNQIIAFFHEIFVIWFKWGINCRPSVLQLYNNCQ